MENRNSRKYTDIGFDFKFHPYSKDVVKVSDEAAIRQSVRNLISTKNYERPFHPEIGCQIFSMLFEPFSPVIKQVMKQTIFDVIEKFEPRVTIINVDIIDDSDRNALSIQIVYRINNTGQPVTITESLSRVR